MPLDLLPDEFQQSLAEAADALLDADASAARLRARLQGRVVDPALWEKAAAQGWFALAVPEDAGGLGLGLTELSLVHEALGRTLTPGPFLGTNLAASVAHRAGSARLEHILAGEPVGLVLSDAPVDSTGPLRGTFWTDDADDASGWLLVTPGSAMLLDRAADLRRHTSTDLAARRAELSFDTEPVAIAVGDDTWSEAMVLVAAQLSGVAMASVSASVRYTNVREQFGRVVGSFQMVQQRMADMATRAEAAKQLSALASLVLASGHVGARQLAASALLIAGDAAVQNARDDIQNHGGLGYTWEVDSHLRLRRAHGLRSLLGDPQQLRDDVLTGASTRPW
jgi:alkylation response protein AidB-like acyl-CoA dehydrogenase